MKNEEQQHQKTLQDAIATKLIYKGREKPFPTPLTVGNLTRNDKFFGSLTGSISGYACPRCAKSFGYLHTSPEGYSYFCGEYECLQDDSASSKENSKIEDKSKEHEASLRFGLGTRYFGASLSRWNANPKHAELVNSWTKSPKNMLVLIGNPNTGKTYFCTAMANYLMQNKKSVRYYNSRRFIEEIQKGIEQSKNQYETVKRIANYDYLILDDLGASSNSEWQQEMILDLIDQRYSANLPTIITSNFDQKAFQEILGERTSRRIFSKENLVITLGNEYAR